jgi:HK97 family phage prohead protease
MKTKETRVFQVEKLHIEERSDGLGPKITGYAAVFNKKSEDLGGFREKIKPGAFKQAIGKSDVRGLFNHDSNFVLGRQSNGTLTLKEDKNGLWMEIEPPDTQIIRDLVIAPIKRGDIREQSFGFIVEEDSWDGLDDEKSSKEITRTILKVAELFDVSPVTFPAYPDTSVALRSMEKAKETPFKVADESDILNISLIQYLEAKEPDESRAAALKIIETLLPKLSDEQRAKLIPTSESDGISPEDDEGTYNESDEEGKTHQTDFRWQEINERVNKILNI